MRPSYGPPYRRESTRIIRGAALLGRETVIRYTADAAARFALTDTKLGR